jgi:hypothetical protein
MTAIVAAAAARARRRRHQPRRLCARPEVTLVAPLLPRLIVERVRKRRAIQRVECPSTIAGAEARTRIRCARVRRPPPQSPHDSRSAGQVINGPGPAGQAPCRDPGPAARPALGPLCPDRVRRRRGKSAPDLAEFSTSVRGNNAWRNVPGLVPLAGAAEHDLVPGRDRGAPAARRLPALAPSLLADRLRRRSRGGNWCLARNRRRPARPAGGRRHRRRGGGRHRSSGRHRRDGRRHRNGRVVVIRPEVRRWGLGCYMAR